MLRVCCDRCSRGGVSLSRGARPPPTPPPPLPHLSAAVACVILRNIAISPWLRYLFKYIKFCITKTRFLALGIEGNPNWYNLYTSGLKYDRITTFIAMPFDVVNLTLSISSYYSFISRHFEWMHCDFLSLMSSGQHDLLSIDTLCQNTAT